MVKFDLGYLSTADSLLSTSESQTYRIMEVWGFVLRIYSVYYITVIVSVIIVIVYDLWLYKCHNCVHILENSWQDMPTFPYITWANWKPFTKFCHDIWMVKWELIVEYRLWNTNDTLSNSSCVKIFLFQAYFNNGIEFIEFWVPAYWLGWRRGAFTCVGWQVTLCDPIWQVTSRSCEMEFH